MRLDYFLKISRIVKRRPLAKEMCDKQLVQVNNQPAKASKDVNTGDIITVKFRNRLLKLQVNQISEQAISKKEASTLYTVLEDIREKEGEGLW